MSLRTPARRSVSRRASRSRRTASWTLAGAIATAWLAAAPAPGLAVDQTLRGSRMAISESVRPSGTVRRVVVSSVEGSSPNTIVGDPTSTGSAGGGLLQVGTEGGTPTSQVFALPQGTSASGRPFWQALSSGGYRYSDRLGEQGPVRSLIVRKPADGTFRLRAILSGAPSSLTIVPPNPGTSGFLTLSLGLADRYCVRFGADGRIRDRGTASWSIGNVHLEGCPALLEGDVLALSYNVAGLPEGISGSHPATNTAIIAPLLNAYELVVLQETWKTPDPNPLAPTRVYHEILEAGADHPYKSISAPQPLGTNPARPSAFLADGLNTFARFPFEPVLREAWAGCDNSAADCLAMKGFSMARMTLAPGVSVDVYDLHMEAGSTANDDLLRDAGVTQLVAFLQAHSAGRAVIVGGDFNLHTDTEPDGTQYQRLLAEAGLTDVCASLACPEPGRIDKFAFRSSSQIVVSPLTWQFQTDVFQDSLGAPLSDHEALAVRFAWSATD